MSLVAIVAAYIVQRLPVNKMETEKTAIAENEADKGQTDETWQSTSAAYRKPKKASAEDWATVNAIAAQYASTLKAKRDKLLEETNTIRISMSPEAVAKRFEWDMAQKAIRDKERELWVEISPYLSKYELRKYKLEHSQTARDLRKESIWFELSEGKFLAIYIYREKMNDLLDSKLGGDTKKLAELERSALNRETEVQRAILMFNKPMK